MKFYKRFVSYLFVFTLSLILVWGVYLSQINPEADSFFYERTEEEQKNLDVLIDYWIEDMKDKHYLKGVHVLYQCLLRSAPLFKNIVDECGGIVKLAAYVKTHKSLLDHFINIQSESSPKSISRKTSMGARVFAVNLYLNFLVGKDRLAMTEWLKSFRYWDSKGTINYEIKNIFELNLKNHIIRTHIEVLYLLLGSNLVQDKRFLAETFQLLRPYEKKHIPIEDLLKLELEIAKLYKPWLDRQNYPFINIFQGRLLNKYHLQIQEILSYKYLSYAESCSKRISIVTEPNSLISYIRYGPNVNTVISLFEGYSIEEELKKLDELNAMRTLLRLFIKLKENKISPSDIENFMEYNPDISTNSLTNKKFTYAEDENMFFIKGTECGLFGQSFYLPDIQE